MEDYHKFYKHRWINPKARSFNSPIHGLGVIAAKPIKKGEIVGVLGGVIIPLFDIEEYRLKIEGEVGIQVNDNFFICPTSYQELKRTGVFNHSCEPNIGYFDSITLVAIRDIKKGEEICFDYAFSETYFKPFRCRCGSKKCRKIIKPNDWKRKEVQKKYGDYFSPYLKGKIKIKLKEFKPSD